MTIYDLLLDYVVENQPSRDEFLFELGTAMASLTTSASAQEAFHEDELKKRAMRVRQLEAALAEARQAHCPLPIESEQPEDEL